MAISYCTVSDMLLVLPSCNQDLMQAAIDMVSRSIEKVCNRVFYQTIETRNFDMHAHIYHYYMHDIMDLNHFKKLECIIDDLIPDANTTVSVDGVLLSLDQYEFYPLNSNPKTSIRLFTTGQRLTIVGNWGYGSIPDGIKHATQFLSRIAYQALLEKTTKNERIGNYQVTYFEDWEHYPTTQLINDVVGQYRRAQVY